MSVGGLAGNIHQVPGWQDAFLSYKVRRTVTGAVIRHDVRNGTTKNNGRKPEREKYRSGVGYSNPRLSPLLAQLRG